MAADMCEIHPFELADDWCGDCGRAFCSECIVYAFGPKKPPLCRACAIGRSGVRKHAARQPLGSRRAIRRQVREKRRQARRAAEAPAVEAQPVSAAMDWESVDRVEPLEPEPAPVAATPEPMMATAAAPPPPPPPPPPDAAPEPSRPPSVYDDLPYAPEDEPELEMRPSFESRLTRRRL